MNTGARFLLGGSVCVGMYTHMCASAHNGMKQVVYDAQCTRLLCIFLADYVTVYAVPRGNRSKLNWPCPCGQSSIQVLAGVTA